MKGRRTAAMLCVLLGHALVVFMLMNLTQPPQRATAEGPAEELFFISEHPVDEEWNDTFEPSKEPVVKLQAPQAPDTGEAAPAEGESAAITQPGYVDWPKEGKEAAARVLAREAEAERVAKMFAGPQGT